MDFAIDHITKSTAILSRAKANFIRIHTLLKVAPVNVKVDLDKVYES